MIRWQKAPYGIKAEFADVPGAGRYLIQRLKPRSREFILRLNNTRTKYYGTADELKKIVDRIVHTASGAV